MSGYRLGRAAELDLNDIWDFIALDNVDAADRWIDRLFESFESLARHPRMGHRRTDLTSYSVRFWPVGSYLVVYRETDDSVEIVAVTHGSRDIPTFLSTRTS